MHAMRHPISAREVRMKLKMPQAMNIRKYAGHTMILNTYKTTLDRRTATMILSRSFMVV